VTRFLIVLLSTTSLAAAQELNLLPMPVKVEQTGPAIAPSGKVHLIDDASLGEEEYILDTTRGDITITRQTRAGGYYAIKTLAQFVGPTNPTIPQVRITDRPRFAYRGLLIDPARHIQSIEFLKRTIDRLASYKINRLQMHLTDDVGWRIEITKFPKLTEIGAWRGEGEKRYGGFYSQEQIRDLVAYADERCVTIVPEIEMPGHAQAAVAAYPQISCSGEPAEVLAEFKLSQRPMCPSNPETIAFVQGMLDEVIELFPSQAIHVGGDECPREPWKTCPRCQAYMKEHGLKDEDALQADFTRRVGNYLRGKGRRMQGWGEIFKGGKLASDAIVQQWLDPTVGAAAAKAGNDVVIAQHEYLYFDYPLERTPLKKVYEFEPLPAGLTVDEARHILGVQAQLWTENFPTEEAQEKQIWPRMLAVAEIGWSRAGQVAPRNFGEFSARAAHHATIRPASR
jgi:hexosaminidase